MGLDTLVLAGGATDGNPSGHTAMVFTENGIYSYGKSHDFERNTSAYLEDQDKYRHTTVYRLNTTPDQEQEMKKYINRNYFNKSDYNIVNHNCATMASEALLQANISQDAMNSLISQGMYPELPPTIGAVMMMAGYKGTLLNQHDSISTYFSEFNCE